MSATSCALDFCTVAAAARYSESQVSGRTLLSVVIAHNVGNVLCVEIPHQAWRTRPSRVR